MKIIDFGQIMHNLNGKYIQIVGNNSVYLMCYRSQIKWYCIIKESIIDIAIKRRVGYL